MSLVGFSLQRHFRSVAQPSAANNIQSDLYRQLELVQLFHCVVVCCELKFRVHVRFLKLGQFRVLIAAFHCAEQRVSAQGPCDKRGLPSRAR